MGAGSSANKGQASRSRFSSWGSSIDEYICGDNALCGDYPEDDLEGFPLFDEPNERRNSVITNPYIEPTPRQPPKLRRAISVGEPSVRRGYTTDYSDNSDDPDTDDDVFGQPGQVRRARSARSLPHRLDEDDYPDRPPILPLTTAYGAHPPPSRRRQPRKKKKQNEPVSGRRPFSPSQLQNAPLQKAPRHQRPFFDYSRQPRPESAYSPPNRRFSEPYVAPLPPKKKKPQYPKSVDDYADGYNYPGSTFDPAPPKKLKPRKSRSHPQTNRAGDSYLADYHLPSQVPPSKPLKPIRKSQPTRKEPNYKVPSYSDPKRPKKTRKRDAPPRKKAPTYPTPIYSGQPTYNDPIIQPAPPIRYGGGIKAPSGVAGGPSPTPFVVGKVPAPKTPYLASHH